MLFFAISTLFDPLISLHLSFAVRLNWIYCSGHFDVISCLPLIFFVQNYSFDSPHFPHFLSEFFSFPLFLFYFPFLFFPFTFPLSMSSFQARPSILLRKKKDATSSLSNEQHLEVEHEREEARLAAKRDARQQREHVRGQQLWGDKNDKAELAQKERAEHEKQFEARRAQQEAERAAHQRLQADMLQRDNDVRRAEEAKIEGQTQHNISHSSSHPHTAHTAHPASDVATRHFAPLISQLISRFFYVVCHLLLFFFFLLVLSLFLAKRAYLSSLREENLRLAEQRKNVQQYQREEEKATHQRQQGQGILDRFGRHAY